MKAFIVAVGTDLICAAVIAGLVASSSEIPFQRVLCFAMASRIFLNWNRGAR